MAAPSQLRLRPRSELRRKACTTRLARAPLVGVILVLGVLWGFHGTADCLGEDHDRVRVTGESSHVRRTTGASEGTADCLGEDHERADSFSVTGENSHLERLEDGIEDGQSHGRVTAARSHWRLYGGENRRGGSERKTQLERSKRSTGFGGGKLNGGENNGGGRERKTQMERSKTSTGIGGGKLEGGITCRGLPGPAPSKLCTGLVESVGYGCRDYTTVSEDGFLLGLQRISTPDSQGRRLLARNDVARGVGNEGQSRPENRGSVPVLLQHGLLVGAESWLMSEPQESSLPFQLASAGFDVWLGNTRCEPWAAASEEAFSAAGNSSAALSGEGNRALGNKEDWDWSWDELARYDLPALVDKVLSTTGAESLLYVGHSQGTLVLLSSLSMGWLPQHQVRAAYLLAPVAYLGHLSSKFARRAADIDFDLVVEETGMHRFSFHNAIGQRVVALVCSEKDIDCTSLVTAITGPNCCVDMKRGREFLPWLPLSSSVKNMAHFAQSVRKGTWRMFDYGWRNWWKYGTLQPPPYDPSKIMGVPMAFAYGGLDGLSAYQDVEDLVSQLQFKPRLLKLPQYGHLDFILGDTRMDNNTVFYDVLRFFKEISDGLNGSA